MYNKIYDLCSVKNTAGALNNGLEQTNRVKYLLSLIEDLNLKYDLDIFQEEQKKSRFYDDSEDSKFMKNFLNFSNKEKQKNNFFNIYLPGSSPYMVIAHHDIVNPASDNANDNSASIINCLAYKLMNPSINVAFTDCEESGGIGAKQLAKKIKSGYFGNIKYVLNLELTGIGGENFFIGDYEGVLQNKIINIFDPVIVDTPFNDSVILRKFGIDSVVITTVPFLNEEIPTKKYGIKPKYKNDIEEEMDFTILYKSHSLKDSLEQISIDDMKKFVENVLPKIF